MAPSQLSNGIYLRSTINAKPEIDPQVLAAFSPDIIPMGLTRPDHDALIAAYDEFIAHDIDSTESKTRIYLRGKAIVKDTSSAVETEVTLKAVPNELILWPQAWVNAPVVGHSTLSASKDGEVVATSTPIAYNPTEKLGRHDAFIAQAEIVSAAGTPKDLVKQVQNWRDLVKHVGQDPTVTTYNAVFADPRSTEISLTTRFRMFENQANIVRMAFSIEAVGTPSNDIDVSLSCFGVTPDSKPLSFGQSRTTILPSKLIYINAAVPKNFDGNITLSVFNDKQHTFGDYSSISVGAYAVGVVNGQETYTLLGAEHMVFHSDIRVKKVLKKFARVREAQATNGAADASTYPFYFRESVTDNGQFPRATSGHSPDIQPLGTLPDANVQTDLGPGNYTVDVSDKRSVGTVVGNVSNYIYLRGTTDAPTSGSVRLFAVPSSLLLYPSQYSQDAYIILDHDTGGDPQTAIRTYNTQSEESPNPILFSEPFNFSDPPPPPPSSDHYCLVAECKPDGTDSDGESYVWPHEEAGDFATGGEYAAWLYNQPYVCQRNISYASNPNAPSQVFYTTFTIPPGFSSAENWQFELRAVNCPPGSYVEMDSSDADIAVANLAITGPDQVAGCQFTGAAPGFTCQIVIRWYANGTTIQNGQRIDGNLYLTRPYTGAMSYELFKRQKIGKRSDSTIRTVRADYPNVDIPGKNVASQKPQPPKIGGAHTRRQLGEKYVSPGTIYVNYLVGSDGIGYNLG
ncbi:hypothetical protein POSPLADRAFT_1056431 [Postia placenta MAD-698-R-SB12]|uniref:Uncharacterized protein n=1 Tax=Postia placenta MAD-698-R-SB12 TaxID=670580 RepID=A0A1X6N3S4_9APHY|nr:hypothetical protein POSPLADRAFT_1056431 [Postia placenta MAD-698-R-SB12]OSX63083.1 hypothetical protein POSPLADRAFT_1056431 [Postia placenta MAD-698-R-SB12]